jgi:NADH-quinone oxidoreductase subunit F
LDLRPIETEPSSEERAAIDALLGPTPDDRTPVPLDEAERRRHLLLPALHALSRAVGWISPGGLGYACRRLEVPPAEGYGVASFYSLFALEPRPRTLLHLCDDIACKGRGADALGAALTEGGLPEWPGEVENATAAWARSPCLGLCERAPAALLTIAGHSPREGAIVDANAATLLEAVARGEAPPAGTTPPTAAVEPRRLLRRVGVVDPSSLDDYRAHGGYEALRRALAMGRAAVVREVAESGLVGRGGAAFPTGRKWDAVQRAAEQPHYVIANADESEPGTFKDRVLLEEDPYAVVEGLTLAGFATGSSHGFLYVRGEYPLAIERLEHALVEARRRGWLGSDILGKGFDFDIELRRGAGAYICGEETALMNSIEGRRGEPRSKPPFPVERGLFGKPTAVNNVETLVAALEVVAHGARAFRAVGTAQSPGTKLFCVSGAVERPGVYEIAHGMSLRALLELAGADAPRAVLLGGAAGSFVAGDELDVPLTLEDTRRIGATLGSGVVFVVGEASSDALLLERIARFFRDESCGQCTPCRVGTVRQEELVARLARRAPRGSWQDERKLLADLGQVLRDASICGLGQTAASAIDSGLRRLTVLPPEAR